MSRIRPTIGKGKDELHMGTFSADRLTIIGCGALGSSLIKGILRSELYEPEHIYVYDSDPSRMAQFQGIHTCSNAVDAVSCANVVFLAVRPQDVHSAMAEVSLHDRILVSMVAGITVSGLQKQLRDCEKVLRTMPNIALRIGEAATAYAVPCNLEADELDGVLTVFRACGTVEPVTEGLIDVATAVNGSGPAYFAYFIDAIVNAASEQGMDSGVALRLALQTARSAIGLIEEAEVPAGELLQQISSRGGTTGAALSIMDERSVDDTVTDAIFAAAARSRELSGELQAHRST